MTEVGAYTAKDFASSQDVRWCPGCGDYAILKSVQKVLPQLGVPKENIVFVSGIGCSSRFPFYVDTFGFHTLHGRAPTIASGIKTLRPDLDVWLVTGDGDGFSIGGNHLIHLLRRNFSIKVLLFNNRIYGLTKGQYSPTSQLGQVTKSSPLGAIDHPINPTSVALGAEASFVARTADNQLKHMEETIHRAAQHKGTAFVEILQNCVIFNDGTWDEVTGKKTRDDHQLLLEHDKPLIYGGEQKRGIRQRGFGVEVVDLADEQATDGLVVHDERATDPAYAFMLSRLGVDSGPTPLGVFRQNERPCYEAVAQDELRAAQERAAGLSLDDMYRGFGKVSTWEV